VVLVGSVSAAVACDRVAAVDKVPVGAEVQLTRKDGALVEGNLANKSEEAVQVDTGRVTRTIARDEIAEVRVRNTEDPAAVPKTAKFREIAVPATTNLSLTLDDSVGSATSRVEEPIRARLRLPVVIDGLTVLPAGARVRGVVSSVEQAGKVKGVASIGLHFQAIDADDVTYAIDARYHGQAEATKASDAKKIGIPAAGGAVVGAIIGGKKGAAIGAAAGGGAGAAVVLSTRGEDVLLPVGSTLVLDAGRAFDVRVPIE
jgi:hypothetical protein